MALPTQKRTKSRKKRKQYQYRIKKLNLVKCPHCGKLILPHHVCPYCGYYLNEEIIVLKSKNKKKK
ncbi:50S ribosomal protein L32 [bacterium]|nr:50S ribosomal protein L32 [bacterium]